MPLYEYKCHRCGKLFEIIQKFSDTPLSVHEGCGGDLEKMLSAPALQFKGSGWYVNDYGHGHNASASNGKSESKNESKSESKAEGKSESKTETKTETKTPAPAADK